MTNGLYSCVELLSYGVHLRRMAGCSDDLHTSPSGLRFTIKSVPGPHKLVPPRQLVRHASRQDHQWQYCSLRLREDRKHPGLLCSTTPLLTGTFQHDRAGAATDRTSLVPDKSVRPL